jgi:DNA mismatch repair protein MutL
MYALFIDLDPAHVDINVHPTKQEIKFEDEKIIYAFVQSAVKHALGQFSITPTLDFELDASIQQMDAVKKPFTEEKKSSAAASSLYSTFTQKNQAHFIENKSGLKHWKDFYEPKREQSYMPQATTYGPEPEVNSQSAIDNSHQEIISQQPSLNNQLFANLQHVTQLHHTYILAQNDKGFILIHQQNAHERVLYERFLKAVDGKPIAIQQSLFPSTIELTPGDTVVLNELLPDLHFLGYQLDPFGNNTFVIQGTPADVLNGNEKTALEKMLEQYKHFSSDLKYSKREKLLRSLAWQQAIKAGTTLTAKEMSGLVEDLCVCASPNITPNGKPTYTDFKKADLDKLFGR